MGCRLENLCAVDEIVELLDVLIGGLFEMALWPTSGR